MRLAKALVLVGFTALVTARPAAADVQLQIQNGQVTLVATNATLRQILTEWSRVGQTKIVNLERVPGGPVTLELRNVSEQEALDVLLRPLSGYMAAPRAAATPNASLFDRIILIPTSSAPRAPVTATAQPPFQQPAFQRPNPTPDEDRDDEQPAPNVVQPPPQRPVFPTFPQPQVVNPQGGPAGAPGVLPPQQGQPGAPQAVPAATPGPQPSAAPFGGSRTPGMIVQPPPQPGQTVNPGQPQQSRTPNDD